MIYEKWKYFCIVKCYIFGRVLMHLIKVVFDRPCMSKCSVAKKMCWNHNNGLRPMIPLIILQIEIDLCSNGPSLAASIPTTLALFSTRTPGSCGKLLHLCQYLYQTTQGCSWIQSLTQCLEISPIFGFYRNSRLEHLLQKLFLVGEWDLYG